MRIIKLIWWLIKNCKKKNVKVYINYDYIKIVDKKGVKTYISKTSKNKLTTL
jgi:ribosomal protein L28